MFAPNLRIFTTQAGNTKVCILRVLCVYRTILSIEQQMSVLQQSVLGSEIPIRIVNVVYCWVGCLNYFCHFLISHQDNIIFKICRIFEVILGFKTIFMAGKYIKKKLKKRFYNVVYDGTQSKPYATCLFLKPLCANTEWNIPLFHWNLPFKRTIQTSSATHFLHKLFEYVDHTVWIRMCI